MTDLRECPFCGGEAILIEGDESAYVQCLDVSCHIGPFFDGDNDASNCAVAEWNRRSDTAARKAAFEEATKVVEKYSIERHWTDEELGPQSGRSLVDPRKIAAAIRALAEKD